MMAWRFLLPFQSPSSFLLIKAGSFLLYGLLLCSKETLIYLARQCVGKRSAEFHNQPAHPVYVLRKAYN